MVQTEGKLCGLIEGHLVQIFAAQLGECADSLVYPLIAVDLSARRLDGSGGASGHWARGANGINSALREVSFGSNHAELEHQSEVKRT